MSLVPYRTLNQDTKEFRLLKLSPAPTDENDPIEATLSEYSLDNAPPYLALSYVWGDPNARADISIQGQVVSVTFSLFTAVKRIRKYAKPDNKLDLYLWADAVCINQSDPDERTQQVKLMRLIYSTALYVVTWLGPYDQDSDPAVDLIKNWSKLPAQPTAEDISLLLREYPQAFDSKVWEAMNDFANHPWWTRVWTYQEFVLSQTAVFLRGDQELSISDLHNAPVVWNYTTRHAIALHLHKDQALCLGSSKHLRAFSDLYAHRYILQHPDMVKSEDARALMSLQGIQEIVHVRKATDPRDKLYGMLGVLPFDSGKVFIEPDYRKTVDEVYTDYAVQTIQSSRSLEILAISGIGYTISSPDQPLNIPSWAPDLRESCQWSSRMSGIVFDATEGLDPWFDISQKSAVLCAQGVVCATVKSALVPDNTGLNWHSFARQHDIPHPTGIPQIQAHVRTMIRDNSDSRSPNDFRSEKLGDQFFHFAVGFMYQVGLLGIRQQGEDKVERIGRVLTGKNNSVCVALFALWLSENYEIPTEMSDEELLIPFTGPPKSDVHLKFPPKFYQAETRDFGVDEMSSFTIEWMQKSSEYKYFATPQGYIGLGPEGMQGGDIVCLLFGCRVPLVLRQDGDHFINVGQCYVYGLMQGELVPDIKSGKYMTKKFRLK